MLQLDNVSKTYADVRVLWPTTLHVPAGQRTVLIGPSGSGKSTLLRLIIGLAQPDSGSVKFQEQLLDEANIREARLRMGYVIQEGGLFPHLTARENVTLMSSYLGWPRERMARRVEELSDLARLPSNCLDRYVSQLSGGQRQRVCLMRTLMLDPDLLLLDEPLGSLDPLIRSELQTDLREVFAKLGKTVLMVTHDLGEAACFGEVIVLLREGRIVQQGTLRELVDSPADPFVTHFINAQRGLSEWLEHEVG